MVARLNLMGFYESNTLIKNKQRDILDMYNLFVGFLDGALEDRTTDAAP